MYSMYSLILVQQCHKQSIVVPPMKIVNLGMVYYCFHNIITDCKIGTADILIVVDVVNHANISPTNGHIMDD